MPQSPQETRRDSWPPTLLRLFDTNLNSLPETDYDTTANTITDEEEDINIDSNPFEYFLTSPTDLLQDDDEDELYTDLTAGIELSHSPSSDGFAEEEGEDAPATPVREISPSTLQRMAILPDFVDSDADAHLLFPVDHQQHGFAVPMTLEDFTRAHESARKTGKKSENSMSLPMPMPLSLSSRTALVKDMSGTALRGRGRVVRVAPRRRGGKGGLERERQRPRSWRVPSPEVYVILEEEMEVDGEGKGGVMSLPVTDVEGVGEQLQAGENKGGGEEVVEGEGEEERESKKSSQMKKSSKKKKRVHWAVGC